MATFNSKDLEAVLDPACRPTIADNLASTLAFNPKDWSFDKVLYKKVYKHLMDMKADEFANFLCSIQEEDIEDESNL